MRCPPDEDGPASPETEWLARVSPFLPADNPHQRCISRARDAGAAVVDRFCDCPPAPCTAPCCAPPEEF